MYSAFEHIEFADLAIPIDLTVLGGEFASLIQADWRLEIATYDVFPLFECNFMLQRGK